MSQSLCQTPGRSPAQRLLDLCIPEPMSGCWIWLGAREMPFGYGKMSIIISGRARTISAHRVSFSEFNSKIPDGMCVLHKCDTPSCVNPKHLFLGTYKQNTQDMMLKGRARLGHYNKIKTHCRNGHPLGAPVYGTKRKCRPCERERYAKRIRDAKI